MFPTSNPYQFNAVVVSPNPAVDSYYPLSDLAVGSVNRSHQVLHTAGGKANNMARAMTMLGGSVLSIGIVGGTSGRFIVKELAREGIACDQVWTDHETRHCITIPVAGRNQVTVVLESGAPAGDKARAELVENILEHAGKAPVLSLNGSLPPDFPDDFYATVIEKLKGTEKLTGKSVRVYLDCSGEALRQGALAGPALIKVNLQEFRAVFAANQEWSWSTVPQIAEKLYDVGVETLVITDGPRGAHVFSNMAEPFRVFATTQSWVSTAGAGDTLLAALALSLEKYDSLAAAMRFATAAATASLQQIVCGRVARSDVEEALQGIQTETLFAGSRQR